MNNGCCSTTKPSTERTSCCQDEQPESAESGNHGSHHEAITPDMTIGDVVDKYPELAPIFTRYGLHCVGCHVSPYETIEQGSVGHGMPEEDFKAMIEEANEFVKKLQQGHEDSAPSPASAKGAITITDAAIAKAKELFNKAGVAEADGLRIKVAPGGCSGFSYRFGFDKKRDGDFLVNRHGFKVFVDPQSLAILNGASVDYVDTLQQSGFKIINPNATSTCGCGSSFQ